MNKFLFISAVFIFSILILSCSKSDLSRSDAEALISKSEAVQELKTEYRVNVSKIREAVGKGLFELGMISYRLTKAGETLFEDLRVPSFGDLRLTTKKPSGDVELSVTGLSEMELGGMKLKEAQFSWSYKNVPEVLRLYAISGGEGVGIFRLYDDGWRLESVEITQSSTPYAVSEKEISEDTKVIEKLILENMIADDPKWFKDLILHDIIPGVGMAGVKIGDSIDEIINRFGKPTSDSEDKLKLVGGDEKRVRIVSYTNADHKKNFFKGNLTLIADNQGEVINMLVGGNASYKNPTIIDSRAFVGAEYNEEKPKLGNINNQYKLIPKKSPETEITIYNHKGVGITLMSKNDDKKNTEKIAGISVPERNYYNSDFFDLQLQ